MQKFKFNDEIHDYQRFVVNNIKLLGNLIVVSEQLFVKNDKNNFIDILALDLNQKQLVILELKNTLANHSIVGQAIKYYDSLIRGQDQLRNLLDLKVNQLGIDLDDINYTPKVILVIPDFDKQLLRSLKYVENIDISIIKLNAIQRNNYFEIIKENINLNAIDNTKVTIGTKVSKNWSLGEYLKDNINSRKIELARQLMNYINYLAKDNNIEACFYFYNNKITMSFNKKIVGHILIRKNPFSEILDISISNYANTSTLMYSGEILKYKFLTNTVSISFSKLPIDFLKTLF
jgi:hypothetical protein